MSSPYDQGSSRGGPAPDRAWPNPDGQSRVPADRVPPDRVPPDRARRPEQARPGQAQPGQARAGQARAGQAQGRRLVPPTGRPTGGRGERTALVPPAAPSAAARTNTPPDGGTGRGAGATVGGWVPDRGIGKSDAPGREPSSARPGMPVGEATGRRRGGGAPSGRATPTRRVPGRGFSDRTASDRGVPDRGPDQPADRTAGEVNTLYDTVDQEALRRVDVRERTVDATVYHKVMPERDSRNGRRNGVSDRDRMTEVTPAQRVAGRRDLTRATELMAVRSRAREGDGSAATRRMAGGRPGADRIEPRRTGPGRPGPGRAGPGRSSRAEMGVPGGAGGPGRRNGKAPRPGQGRHGPMWWRRRPRWLRRLVFASFFSGLLLFAAGIGVIYAATRVPLPAEVKTDQTSIIFYGPPAGSHQDNGEELARIGTVNRTDVPLAEVSVDMQHAVLAAEDKNFYHEPGISPKGIARALYVNVTGGELQGGSTITQQYAKNAYLSQERTFTRKMREIVLAVKLGQKYSKGQILEFYLNTIYFGRGAYGIEAAAKAYFNTSAAKLTPAQGAVIAGLIRSPNYLDPAKNPGPAANRWHDVVATMVAEGWAPPGLAQQSPPPVAAKAQDAAASSDQIAYIRDQVKRELTTVGKITEDQINRGGLRITTTIDKGRQFKAFQAVSDVLGPAYAAVPDLRTGLTAIEPGTGRILAWYGGSLYGKDAQGHEQYVDNVSGAQVQSASTFKTITLVAALRQNINLKSTFAAPAKITLPGNYVVSNDEGEAGDLGYKNLIEATAGSINTVYVPLGQNIGVSNIIKTARDLGIPASTQLRNEAGITLGQDDVHAVDMTTVYATLAGAGVRATPHIVDKVVDGNGQVIYSGTPDVKQVIPATVARDATYALQSVLTDSSGTGKRARLDGGREAAGKTGTSTNFRSAWFCGYTRELASCVNMFRGKGTEQDVLKGIPGAEKGVYGGTYPAKVWKAFMDAALTGVPPSKFDPPAFGGLVQDNEPEPTPTPTPAPSASSSQPGDTGVNLGDLLNPSGNGNGGGQQQGAGQAGRPARQTGIFSDPFN
ncbi:glycosyl transferase [Frankia sp. CcI156]|uniref:transglycosylase domain-containing protein n=1 Tax=unclassified Frankia TaxID=2632575 RepID=UPI00040FE477|nr:MULTISPECIES: transglycosylase domain-containing protein [unclassified Frankia]OHV54970.1 glycosyl transferase [Frankia sp. CgIS1]ONH27214.1 glycosyl transferase [Frankia sp. CcI156]